MKKHIIKLLVAIVDRGKGERIVSICREQRTLMQTICLGHGTASSEVLDLLGLGRTEKAVVLTLVRWGSAGAFKGAGRSDADLRPGKRHRFHRTAVQYWRCAGSGSGKI